MTLCFPSQNLCKELAQKIDVVDEERYDINSKVSKNDLEVIVKSSYIKKNTMQCKVHIKI